MNRLRALALLAVAALLLASGCSPPPPPPLMVGQTWMIHARPADGATSISLLHVEADSPLGDVGFISINNAAIALPDGRRTNKIWPVAIRMDSLRASLKSHVGAATVPLAYEQHVQAWRQAVASGGAAAFTFDVPVAQALSQLEAGKLDPWASASRDKAGNAQ
jgi:hypothetical protein